MWGSFFGSSVPETPRSILRGSPTAVDESGNVRDLEWHVQFEPRRNLAEWLTWEEDGVESAKARRTEDVDLDNLPEKGGPTFTMKASDWQPAATDSKSRKAARQAAKSSRGAKQSEAAALTARTSDLRDDDDDEGEDADEEGAKNGRDNTEKRGAKARTEEDEEDDEDNDEDVQGGSPKSRPQAPDSDGKPDPSPAT